MSDRYHCALCGHNGQRIDEQKITITRRANGTWTDEVPRLGTAAQTVTRWVCFKCGEDVKPL